MNHALAIALRRAAAGVPGVVSSGRVPLFQAPVRTKAGMMRIPRLELLYCRERVKLLLERNEHSHDTKSRTCAHCPRSHRMETKSA